MLHHSSQDGSGEAKRSLLRAFSANRLALPRRGRNRNEPKNGEQEYRYAEEEYLSSDSNNDSNYNTDIEEGSMDNSKGDWRPKDNDTSDDINDGNN